MTDDEPEYPITMSDLVAFLGVVSAVVFGGGYLSLRLVGLL